MTEPATPNGAEQETGGEAAADPPVFYFDLGSPYAWLTAERIHDVLGEPAVWQPILLGGIWQQTGGGSWARTDARADGMAEIERRAAGYGLLPVRWPDPWPSNSLAAMRAATFAQQAGRTVAFALAAFRQAFCAGRDLAEVDNVLIAAAACELHPNAIVKGIETKSVKDRLRAATEEAAARGVIGVPTVAVGDQLFWGDDRLEDAAAAALVARRG
ncbi:MAG: disulfide bond formation protein DsbA [Solirubrobacterales bacterium]|nr:disulfide bond formation protein DsbA [Solirubrobacterales bacterium]